MVCDFGAACRTRLCKIQHCGCQQDQVEILSLLLASGANVYKTDGGDRRDEGSEGTLKGDIRKRASKVKSQLTNIKQRAKDLFKKKKGGSSNPTELIEIKGNLTQEEKDVIARVDKLQETIKHNTAQEGLAQQPHLLALKNRLKKLKLLKNRTKIIQNELCNGITCTNHGKCINHASNGKQLHDYKCKCETGWSGKDCQTDIDNCKANPCQNGATCVDGIGFYKCECMDGFNGKKCEKDINDCRSKPCKNRGTCIDGVSSYTCTCAAGYIGTDCKTPEPIPTGCKLVCAKDTCKGTLTNPIPPGIEWTTRVHNKTDSGCCFAKKGACDLCCPPEERDEKDIDQGRTKEIQGLLMQQGPLLYQSSFPEHWYSPYSLTMRNKMEKLLSARGALTTVLPDDEDDSENGGGNDHQNQCETSWKGLSKYLVASARQGLKGQSFLSRKLPPATGQALASVTAGVIGGGLVQRDPRRIYSSQARRNEYARRWYHDTFRPPLSETPESGPGLSMWLVKDPSLTKAAKRMCCTGATATNIMSKLNYKIARGYERKSAKRVKWLKENTGEKAKEIESENQKSFEENSKKYGGIAETLEDKIKGGKDVGLGEEKGGIIGLGTEVTEVGLTSLHKAGHWLAGTGREFKRKIKEGLQKSE